MKQRSSKVQKMITSFMEYHEQGYSISYIAKIFNISDQSIYRNLSEIALANGVKRESLLEQPKTIVKNAVSTEEIDLNGLAENFYRLEKEFSDVIGKFEQIAKE